MEGDFIQKDCCGETFGHRRECRNYQEPFNTQEFVAKYDADLAAALERERVLRDAVNTAIEHIGKVVEFSKDFKTIQCSELAARMEVIHSESVEWLTIPLKDAGGQG